MTTRVKSAGGADDRKMLTIGPCAIIVSAPYLNVVCEQFVSYNGLHLYASVLRAGATSSNTYECPGTASISDAVHGILKPNDNTYYASWPELPNSDGSKDIAV